MRSILLLTTLLICESVIGCISSNPRQYSAGLTYQVPTQQNIAPPAPQPAVQQPSVGAIAQGAPNEVPVEQIPLENLHNAPLSEQLLGSRVGLQPFGSEGYNAEGGGPVSYGAALQCDFEQRPCCWANVPTPDDQIDWQLASGVPESQRFRNVSIDGRYLVAYAVGAAPSDEAQFASCSIGCASSPIRVRAKHWQSENVLLQVCQRESFPNSVNFNPLLNCQEFPMVQGLGFTELVLPKASLVDIVFVASNFVGENGDIAVLDNIEILYESDPKECENDQNQAKEEAPPVEKEKSPEDQQLASAVDKENELLELGDGDFGKDELSKIESQGTSSNKNSFSKLQVDEESAIESLKKSSSAASASALSSKTAAASELAGVEGDTALEGLSEISSSASKAIARGENTFVASEKNSLVETSETVKELEVVNTQICQTIKCTFEDGTTCAYKDAFLSQSIRGLTTKFQVVEGQFMNRVTGVHSGIQGDYYAATYLYPREMAGLQAEVLRLNEEQRFRFRYYEGTHGVQLKGCCGSDESCPFSSDKFVSVSDRMWKFGSFSCPKGTEKIIFICENTRTNQGACALDDIQVVRNDGETTLEEKPLC